MLMAASISWRFPFTYPNGEQFALLDEPEPVEALPESSRTTPVVLENDPSQRRVRLADLVPVGKGSWMK
jgi:hypothetical protein